jgi:hypothetical protein
VTTAEKGWSPQNEGQRPPFEPGNELAIKSGAYSPRRVDPLAGRLVENTINDPETAYLAAPRFRAAVWGWARAQARVELLTEWLEDHDSSGVDDDGDVLPVLTALRMWEVRAANALSKLGMDPMSAARLGRDRAAGAADLARVMQELHRRDGEGGER